MVNTHPLIPHLGGAMMGIKNSLIFLNSQYIKLFKHPMQKIDEKLTYEITWDKVDTNKKYN